MRSVLRGEDSTWFEPTDSDDNLRTKKKETCPGLEFFFRIGQVVCEEEGQLALDKGFFSEKGKLRGK